MDFEKYKKLENRIERQSFEKSYKNINIWGLIFSLLGNTVSIFFAYFLLFSLIKDSMPSVENTIWISITTIVFLFIFEMLKRYVFNKFSIEHIRSKFKFLTKEVLILTAFSLFIIAGSFYLSLNGAKKFTDQLDIIVEEGDKDFLYFQDSLNSSYEIKINDYNDKNLMLVNDNNLLTNQNIKINEEAENINSFQTKRAKYKLIEQNNERINNNQDKIDNNDERILSLEDERDLKISDKKNSIIIDNQNLLEKGDNNSIKFLILSTFIELIILIGIYFNCFYDYKSLKEHKEKIKADPNYSKWINYKNLLQLIYNNGVNSVRVGDYVVSNNKIIDIAKINNYLKMDKNVISDGFKVLNHLGIITTRGSKRIIEVDYEIAKEVLKDYFKIE